MSNRKTRYGKLVRGFDWRTTEERLQRINVRCESLGLTKTEYIQYAIDKESMGNPVFEIKDFEGYNVATVIYEDGSMFTVGDWQSSSSLVGDEIAAGVVAGAKKRDDSAMLMLAMLMMSRD